MDNKRLTEILSTDLGLSREETESLMSSFSEVVGDCVSKLDTVVLPGFGAFEPKKRMERVVVHPASGSRLLVPPKIVVSFRPSTSLKQKIRNGKQD